MKEVFFNKRKLKILISSFCILLSVPLVVIPIVTVIVYESIFSMRYETADWMEFSVSDYEGLTVQRSDFLSDNGISLAGYKYQKDDTDPKGVVIISHGLGGGGQNQYMPVIDCLTSGGYYVFSYDASGNDNSGGKSVEGFPQGIVDLDMAICHLSEIEEYKGLPICLFGHSWGAYSVGNVLNLHPEIKAAVLMAGFDESEDMLLYYSQKYVGSAIKLLLPYVTLYERLKFGSRYTDISAVEGMANTNAAIMIVQSRDDTNVPMACGYDKFYENFSRDGRFEFILYEDKGHGYVHCSEEALDYHESINARYEVYVEKNGGKYNNEMKQTFMEQNLDKQLCFDLDDELMLRIIGLYDSRCTTE